LTSDIVLGGAIARFNSPKCLFIDFCI